jgi:hypothetical protein
LRFVTSVVAADDSSASDVVAGTPRAVAGDTLIAGDDRRDLE